MRITTRDSHHPLWLSAKMDQRNSTNRSSMTTSAIALMALMSPVFITHKALFLWSTIITINFCFHLLPNLEISLCYRFSITLFIELGTWLEFQEHQLAPMGNSTARTLDTLLSSYILLVSTMVSAVITLYSHISAELMGFICCKLSNNLSNNENLSNYTNLY